jgi:hypothetical protein
MTDPHSGHQEAKPWEESIQNIITRSMDFALNHSWSDDICYLDARIAANYAFQLHSEWREPRSWIHPQAMQFRGTKGGRWVPGMGSINGEVQP